MKFNFSPSPAFNDDAKRKFLAAFDARHPAPRPASWLAIMARVLAAALAIIAIGAGGATVYADAANVPADSPLYPFKRLGESIQLAAAPSEEHAALEASFAARRVAELNDLEQRHPTSTMAAKLSDDADAEVNASINDAEKADLGDGELAAVCVRLFAALASSSTTMTGELHGNLIMLGRFTARCEATSTEATATIEMRIRDYLDRHASSSATSSDDLEGAADGHGAGSAVIELHLKHDILSP